MKQEFETIIIGGGMSGIGCARTLAEKRRNFLLISKDIGGRVISSADGDVNYGAFYIRSDYRHVLPLVRLGRKISIRSARFQRGDRSWTIWSVLFKHPIAALKLRVHLLIFNFHYQKFKRNCEHMAQIDALQKDPYLVKMYALRATDFLETHGLTMLIPILIDPIVRSTSFLDVEEMSLSAAEMLCIFIFMLYDTHEFRFQRESLVAGISDHLIEGEVISIERKEGCWIAKTDAGNEYHSKNLVMATPIDVTKRLLQLEISINHPISVHMAHVRGKLLSEYEKSRYFVLFSSHKTQDIVIAKESNHTYLFYSHNPHYDLSKYFMSYEVIAEKFWHPAFFIGHEFLPTSFENNLFVIGDHNVVGMEDAYITGIYAANKIIAQS